MTKRPPWGHVSRHCLHCGKVGPRVIVAFGYAHRRCIREHEKRMRQADAFRQEVGNTP